MSFDFSKVLNKVNNTKGHGNSVMLLDFLKTKNGETFGNHIIQTEGVLYLRAMYNKMVSPDTLSRLWRELRAEYKDNKEESLLYKSGITFTEVDDVRSVQKHYKIGVKDES